MQLTRVLFDEPGLARAITDGARRAAAGRELVARVLHCAEGPWDAEAYAPYARGGFGLLVLDGVLIRRVGRAGRYGAELLGAGDLLRPWQHDGEDGLRPFATDWRALMPARLAVLDPGFARRAAPYPEVAAALAGRALQRARVLAVHMAIVQRPRVDDRLHLVLWELAERHGETQGDDGQLNLPLTHAVLAELVAAQRPSVSTALGSLESRGLLVRGAGAGWQVRRPRDVEGDGRAGDRDSGEDRLTGR